MLKNIKKLLEATAVLSLLMIFFFYSECTADLRDPDYLTPTTKELVQKSDLICKGEVLQVSTVGDTTEKIQKFSNGSFRVAKYNVMTASYKCDQVLKGDKSNEGKIITVKFLNVDLTTIIIVDSSGLEFLFEPLSKDEYLLLFLTRNDGSYVLTYPNLSITHQGSKRFISKDSLEGQSKGEDPAVASVRELIRAEESDKSFSAKLLELTLNYIKENGPDDEVVRQVGSLQNWGWSKRDDLVKVTIPYLKDTNPAKAAGALEILYRLRSYRPMEYLTGMQTWEQKNSGFYSQIDQVVYAQIPYFQSLNNNSINNNLALYLGNSPSEIAKETLLRLALISGSEQAAICLTWHRDETDMKDLFPFMLGDNPGARSLPYHFGNSYGKASIPYLKRALTEAKLKVTRLEAAFELVLLRQPEGFDYLRGTILKDPDTFDRIRQFTIDRLSLSRDVKSKEEIAGYLDKKKKEL